MTFFDKKEEVIEIQLTPYGKHLLSLGKMKPSYYAFFDDDILYNIESVQSASLTEENTESFERIASTTPATRPMRSFIGVETQKDRQDFYLSEEKILYPSVNERAHYLLNPIGTNDETSTKSPAWEITFIQGEMNTVARILSGSTYGYEQIPQIDADVTYSLSVKNQNDYSEKVRGRKSSANLPISKTYSDGTFLDLSEDQILLNVLEKNGFNFRDSIEVEVFLVDDIDSNILKPLRFLKRKESVIDNKLIEEPEQNHIEIDDSYVEYYFDFRTDKQIPEDDICQGLKKLKTQDIHLDLEVDCVDREGFLVDIYGSRVTNIEDCD